MRVVSLIACALVLAGCGSGSAAQDTGSEPGSATGVGTDQGATDTMPAPRTLAPGATPSTPDQVTVEVPGGPSARFAGLLAADVQGFYQAENLEVLVEPSGPDTDPLSLMATPDGPALAVTLVPNLLQAREHGLDVVDIAQIFQRSGTRIVSLAPSSVTSIPALAGKKVALLDQGRGDEVTAAAGQEQLKAGKDYQAVAGPFDVAQVVDRTVDASQVMAYDEYARILETTNPQTGKLYQPPDLVTIDFEQAGLGMLGDAIVARESWLALPGNEDIAVRFLRATFRGWIYCRDHPGDCAQLAVDAGSDLGLGHQAWMINEVNALIWPSPAGIGVVDGAAWDRTAAAAVAGGLIGDVPVPETVRTDLAQKALAGLSDLDVKGPGFAKGSVAVSPGGE